MSFHVGGFNLTDLVISHVQCASYAKARHTLAKYLLNLGNLAELRPCTHDDSKSDQMNSQYIVIIILSFDCTFPDLASIWKLGFLSFRFLCPGRTDHLTHAPTELEVVPHFYIRLTVSLWTCVNRTVLESRIMTLTVLWEINQPYERVYNWWNLVTESMI